MIPDSVWREKSLLPPDDQDVDDEPDDEGGEKDELQEDDQHRKPEQGGVAPVGIEAFRVQVEPGTRLKIHAK